MTVIDPNSVAAVQAELIQGENILWAGKPSSSVVFHGEDLFLIPFSLLWGGFALFWEAGAAGLWGAGSQQGGQWVFGIPFVVIGQYLIWGRFFYVAWKKKRTHYAITTQRVLVVQNTWRHWMVSAYIGALPAVSKNEHKKGIGTLSFGFPDSMLYRGAGRSWGTWDAMSMGATPTFADVPDVDYLYRLVCELREKANATYVST